MRSEIGNNYHRLYEMGVPHSRGRRYNPCDLIHLARPVMKVYDMELLTERGSSRVPRSADDKGATVAELALFQKLGSRSTCKPLRHSTRLLPLSYLKRTAALSPGTSS
jgi:hypothetical protein